MIGIIYELHNYYISLKMMLFTKLDAVTVHIYSIYKYKKNLIVNHKLKHANYKM